MIKGVIFDLDGVITDTAKYHYEAWKNLAHSIGIEIDEKFNEKLKGLSRMDSLDMILRHGGKEGDYTDEEKHELAEKKNAWYIKLLENLDESDILPGIKPFIKELKDRGIKISLASISKNAPLILKKLDLYGEFDFIADPTSVKKGKPAPDIFISAANGINIPIEDVVGIEDSEAGVQAMKACNMRSIGIGVEADITLDSTDELTLSAIEDMQNNNI